MQSSRFIVDSATMSAVSDETLLAWAAEALELGHTAEAARDADHAVEILEEIGAIRPHCM